MEAAASRKAELATAKTASSLDATTIVKRPISRQPEDYEDLDYTSGLDYTSKVAHLSAKISQQLDEMGDDELPCEARAGGNANARSGRGSPPNLRAVPEEDSDQEASRLRQHRPSFPPPRGGRHAEDDEQSWEKKHRKIRPPGIPKEAVDWLMGESHASDEDAKVMPQEIEHLDRDREGRPRQRRNWLAASASASSGAYSHRSPKHSPTDKRPRGRKREPEIPRGGGATGRNAEEPQVQRQPRQEAPRFACFPGARKEGSEINPCNGSGVPVVKDLGGALVELGGLVWGLMLGSEENQPSQAASQQPAARPPPRVCSQVR